MFAITLFSVVPTCKRQVIDIAGDGRENAGSTDTMAPPEAIVAGIMINDIAIEDPEPAIAITHYYRRWIITPGGFVVTARGLQDCA
jgi:Ca-activated chloride channel homolog